MAEGLQERVIDRKGAVPPSLGAGDIEWCGHGQELIPILSEPSYRNTESFEYWWIGGRRTCGSLPLQRPAATR